jgi:dTDP-4-amino-4,6-dideoxygalactose transaminase
MLVTDRPDWAARARYLTTQAKDDPDEYVHGAIGYNYRLTNLQAALGCAQLERLDAHLAAKRRLAHAYAAALEGSPGLTGMPEAPWARSSFWMYTVLVNEGVCGLDARALKARLRAAGIETAPLWQPLHQSPAHRRSLACGGETAEALHRSALRLPSSVGLSEPDQVRVIEALKQAVARP